MTIFMKKYKINIKNCSLKIALSTSNRLYIYNYKNINFLRQYVSITGKIIPRYFNNLTSKEHQLIIRAIERARNSRFILFVWLNI